LKLDGENAHIKSFVLRGGRFSKGQHDAYTRLKERFIIDTGKTPRLEFSDIFTNDNPVVVEVGFGSGSATAEIAASRRSVNYLGIEVYKPGIGNLCKLIEAHGLPNIRIIEGDAYEVFRDSIPGESVQGVHLFFPDPWPKKRHHKRRLVRPEFAEYTRNCLVPGGYIYFVTDWKDYAEHAVKVLDATTGIANSHAGYAPPRSWRPVTRFHRKGEESDRRIFELYYVKQ
jgi:tRNA (guanine-N7-)-methyltransferase